MTYQPTLIVLDSLTRLHTQDENNAGAMAGLFNDSINTLTKETGAAVVILHHTNKVESNSSYAKTRGSSDIGAAVDAAFEARKGDAGQFSLIHFKSRRKQAGDVTRLDIQDNPDGTVSIVPATVAF
jgi:RecA-family ATPase